MYKCMYSGDKHFHFILISVLAIAFLVFIGFVYYLGQTRHFTIDEYQYGCMTYLVSQGKFPYVDYYEHHPPLSHFLHALILKLNNGSFQEKALLLRKISFFYLFLFSTSCFFYFYHVTRKYSYALLGAMLPISIGFGLMSSIDYRADCFGSVLLAISMLGIDVNKSLKRKSLSLLCGILIGLSVFMSQKFIYFGGFAIIILFIHELNERYLCKDNRLCQLNFPIKLISGVVAVTGIIIILCACFGFLPEMIQSIFFGAMQHEKVYPAIHFSKYIHNYINQTKFSSIIIGFFAVYFLVDKRDILWASVCFSAIFSVFLIKAQYPYNFVFPSFVLGICSLRGIYCLSEKQPLRFRKTLHYIFYFALLFLIYDQVSFTFGKSNNTHQLKLLSKIEEISTDSDRFIDNSGGALFLEPATYYFQHGSAHRTIYRKYFSEQLIPDYKKSGARFLIHDFRQNGLPINVQSYLKNRFIHLDGDLYVYGLKLQPNPQEEKSYQFEVLKPGNYYIFDNAEKNIKDKYNIVQPKENGNFYRNVLMNGKPIESAVCELEKGIYQLTILPSNRVGYISCVAPHFFIKEIEHGKKHSMLFEY